MRGWCAQRGGFTVLEAVAALSLLVAISAVVAPSFFERSRIVLRQEACRSVESAVRTAQAAAREEGRVCRVLASGVDPCTLWSEPVTEAGPTGVGKSHGEGAAMRSLGELPARCRVERERPDGGTLGGVDDTVGRTVVGWAAPDGTFVAAPGVVLVADGLRATLGFGAWTGGVTCGAWAAEGDAPDLAEEGP